MKKFLSFFAAILFAGSLMAADLTVDFESPADSYADWVFTTFKSQQTNSNVPAHGGSYFGNTDGKTSGSVVTAEKVNPSSITFYVSKQSTNTTASYWLVKVSEDGSNWTQVDDPQSAASGITRGQWTEVTRDLSNYSDVYVGIFYQGTTAVRCIDDIALSLAEGGDDPDPTVQTLYLNPGASWLSWPAKYAVYYFKSEDNTDNGWSEFMTLAENEESIYTTTIPLGYDKVIFARINGEATTPNWDAKWSQTVNLDLPTDGKNQFTVTSGDQGSECDGEWGTYTPTVFEDVYFVNKDGWAEDEIKLFGWLDSENNGWPGVAMTKTSSKLFGYDVYKGKIKETFTNVIISENGDDTKRSGDQVFDKENPYFYDGAWYASLSVIPANCAIINASSNGTAITLKAGAVVVYAEGKYNYIKDESGVTLIYKQDFGLQTGDTILANIAGSVSVYKNLPEFVPTATSIGENEVKAGDAPAIADATDEPKAENLNQVVVYKNVTFESEEYSSKTITGLWNDKEITFYDQLNKAIKFDTEKIYNVTAAIAVYNSTYQAYIIAAEPVCQDGPYAILVNGEDIVEAVATEDQGEYKQFVAYLSLEKDDEIALLNTSCGATWMPAIEEGGMSAHFAVAEGKATIDTTGCFDLYIKMKSGDDKIFIGAGICEGDTVYPGKYYITGDSALVVDAGLDAEKKWNADAIKAEADTFVLNLKAEQEYKLKVTLDGTWGDGKVKGINDLTEKAEGLHAYEGEDNIVFSLAEAGEVKVIYIAGDEPVFKLIGNFLVPDPTVSVFGTMTDPAWGVEVPFTLAEDKKSASITANIGEGEYEFKVMVNGEYRSNGYTYHREFTGAADITENNDANMVFDADVKGDYTISWFFANDSIDFTYPEKPVVIPAKFYVTGDSALVVDAGLEAAKAWAPNAFKAENDTIALSLKANQEYKLKITLDGYWETGRGYSSLSEVPAGVRNDNDDNIIFSLAEEGEVKVIYFVENEQVTYKIEGNFYVKPVILKDLYLVPGVWAEGDAKIAAWIWGKNYEGRFTEFMAPKAEGNDTLVVQIDSDADHVTFVRFNNTVVAPTWDNESENVWDKAENMEIADCGIFFVNYWHNYSWCEPVEVQIPVILFEGSKHVSWDDGGIDIEAAKFENAKAGDKIVVTYNNASDVIEFKEMVVWSHIAGSRINAGISGDGTYEQFLTAKAVEQIKAHGLQIIGGNFNCTKVELVAGRELKEDTTVWAGYFWVDGWKTITLYPEGYNYVDFSKVQALRIYSEANRTDYIVKIVKQWDNPFVAYADVEDFNINEEYAELTMTDELRTALQSAGQWDIQFSKESGDSFNVTEIVLVMNPGTGTGIENNAAEVKAVKVLKNGMILIMKGENSYNMMGQKVQ